MQQYLQKNFSWLITIAVICHLPALFLPILEPDGALYASIAKQMALNNDFVNLYGDGQDWLDKPHFPFWMAALSFKLFGVSAFAYKLPAFIFWLLGLRCMGLLATPLFGRSTAMLGMLIYVTALHTLLSNFDVRAEPYLTTCILAALLFMYRYSKSGRPVHVIMAALATGCAIMTKGIFVLVTIGGGWCLYWLLTLQFRQFVNYRWWLYLLLSFLFILPELYCLYMQFDSQPQKTVFGRQGVSGIRFFFWDSQFGRFFNTGPIKGKGDIFFFFHTLLWAFFPWSIALYGAVIAPFFSGRRLQLRQPERWILYGSALVTFVMFSLSKFQLPHYIVIIFPFLALLCAEYLMGRPVKIFERVQPVVLVLATACMIAAGVFIRFNGWLLCVALIVLLLTVMGLYMRVRPPGARLIIAGVGAMALASFFLFLFLYPFLFRYQSGQQAAGRLRQLQPGNIPVGQWQQFSYSLEFYHKGAVTRVTADSSAKRFLAGGGAIYTHKPAATALAAQVPGASVITIPHYPVSRLQMNFLRPSSRQAQLEERALILPPGHQQIPPHD